jgi:hypothetical protein
MILEYSLDYRSPSDLYARVFLQMLKECNLHGNISQEHFELRLFVESASVEELEKFADSFAKALPHSIFLYGLEASIIEQMPSTPYQLSDTKYPTAPCPKCLSELVDPKSSNYYNIYTHCSLCGYPLQGEANNYQPQFQAIAQAIKEGQVASVDTMNGRYSVGLLTDIDKCSAYQLLAYDIATVQKYTHCQEYELQALASIEKPSIRLPKTLQFSIDIADIKQELFSFCFANDAILYLLTQELHSLGIDIVAITKEPIESSHRFELPITPPSQEVLEVVASKSHRVIVRDKPPETLKRYHQEPNIDAFYSIIEEHHIADRYDTIAALSLSQKHPNNILIYSKKFALIEYLSLESSFASIADIFAQITQSSQSAQRLIANYQAKFPELYEAIKDIGFENKAFNIYRLWGVIAIILGFTKSSDPLEGAKLINDNAMSFLGSRGPRIDYKLINQETKASLDPLMTIRTAVSFKLAGVDKLTLSYGIVESFVEFLGNQVDELKESMQIQALCITGSLLANRAIFQKVSDTMCKESDIYYNNTKPLLLNSDAAKL